MKYIAFFDKINIADGPLYGGKNASLGEMYQQLSKEGIIVPYGFAISTKAYWKHLNENNLTEAISEEISRIDYNSISSIGRVGRTIREMIKEAPVPDDLVEEIRHAYKELSVFYEEPEIAVAVRSSATAEDLPQASFAGQQETFLNVVGANDLISAVRDCMASLFTDRAIVYRNANAIAHMDVGLSVGVQKMVRADTAVSGILFTLEPETGHQNFISINASYGLGEPIVQGQVNPDEFLLAKEQLRQGYPAIVRRFLGAKAKRLVYRQSTFFDRLFPFHGGAGSSVVLESVNEREKNTWSLTDAQLLELGKVALQIEAYYSKLHDRWMPMDVEWVYDGQDGKLYIVQARPETVHSQKNHTATYVSCDFVTHPSEDDRITEGARIGYGIVSGRASVLRSVNDEDVFADGDILVADMTDPDWLPLMERASAVITNKGGRASHAAIVSRELGIPAVVGTIDAMRKIVDGELITIDCSAGDRGAVYRGEWEAHESEVALAQAKASPVAIRVNTSDPLRAIDASFLPVDGVGLARLEFVVAQSIGVHPRACAEPELVKDSILREVISKKLLAPPERWGESFVHMLADAIGTIAAAFYPRRVLIRTTDFKTNEYAALLGGKLFEHTEENPMLGLRGAARYMHPAYQAAFDLELQALQRVRTVFGLQNCQLLVPFVRRPEELAAVAKRAEAYGMVRNVDGFEISMMLELPENILSLADYLPYCDGFSIGSNDLTQLVLGVDRDTADVQRLYDENDPAVHEMIKQAIDIAKQYAKPIGLCGQGAADSAEFRDFLIRNQIDYISMPADAVVRFLADL